MIDDVLQILEADFELSITSEKATNTHIIYGCKVLDRPTEWIFRCDDDKIYLQTDTRRAQMSPGVKIKTLFWYNEFGFRAIVNATKSSL